MDGIFTISLDFELHWGVFDKKERAQREACYRNTLKLIPRLLDLFAAYEVHVTWATVGSLLAKDRREWEQWKPVVQPDYRIERYSAYRWVDQHDIPWEENGAHFAPDIINSILRYPGQELGSHTFSHYYCLEQQNEPRAFEADLAAAQQAAGRFNTKLQSLVFPRNQFNQDYLKTCFEQGFTTVRSNPAHWYWKPVTNTGVGIIRKIIRTADAYVQIGNTRTSYPLKAIHIKPGEPLQLPASRFLRPWRFRYLFANTWQLKRICRELRTAARYKECYHLWWHPENFGDHPEENMATLRVLLEEYKKCSKKYGMKSWNMGEYAAFLLNEDERLKIQEHAAASC
jgi:peptidoglycan/xylan/chitin deacetylase (PgdA/CDA1 family)